MKAQMVCLSCCSNASAKTWGSRLVTETAAGAQAREGGGWQDGSSEYTELGSVLQMFCWQWPIPLLMEFITGIKERGKQRRPQVFVLSYRVDASAIS